MLSHALELSNQDDCKIFQNPNIHQIQTNQPKIPIIWLRNYLFYYVGSHTTNCLLRKRGMDSYLWSTKVSNLLLKLKSHFNWFRGREEEKHVHFDVSKIIMCKYNLILNYMCKYNLILVSFFFFFCGFMLLNLIYFKCKPTARVTFNVSKNLSQRDDDLPL